MAWAIARGVSCVGLSESGSGGTNKDLVLCFPSTPPRLTLLGVRCHGGSSSPDHLGGGRGGGCVGDQTCAGSGTTAGGSSVRQRNTDGGGGFLAESPPGPRQRLNRDLESLPTSGRGRTHERLFGMRRHKLLPFPFGSLFRGTALPGCFGTFVSPSNITCSASVHSLHPHKRFRRPLDSPALSYRQEETIALSNVADTADADAERFRIPTFCIVDDSRGSFFLDCLVSLPPKRVALFVRVSRSRQSEGCSLRRRSRHSHPPKPLQTRDRTLETAATTAATCTDADEPFC